MSPAAARADIGKGDGEIGFDFGTTRYDLQALESSGTHVSLRGGYFFTRRLQLEGNLRCQYGDERNIAREQSRFSACTGDIGGLVNFRGEKRVVPFVRVGVGQTQLDRDTEPAVFDIDERSGSWLGAIGMRIYFGGRRQLALRVEATRLDTELLGDRTSLESATLGVAYRVRGSR